MKKILFVNACVRPDSRTYRIAKELLNKLNGTVEEVNLSNENIQPLNWESLQKRDEYISLGDFSSPIFKYAKQFADADEIVIAAPYWDLSFPSIVKIYLEAITVTGITFKYTSEGIPVGLCKAKRIFYVTTAGGAIGNSNWGLEYIKSLAENFYGIDQTIYFKAENLDIIGNDPDEIVGREIDKIRSIDVNNIK